MEKTGKIRSPYASLLSSKSIFEHWRREINRLEIGADGGKFGSIGIFIDKTLFDTYSFLSIILVLNNTFNYHHYPPLLGSVGSSCFHSVSLNTLNKYLDIFEFFLFKI